jgi:phosphoglycolate phosphatase
MKRYRYVLFDLDGTLIYSHPGIFACFRYALEKMGRENPTDEQLFPCIGPSLHYSFANFFAMSDEEATKAVALYRERYKVKGVYENTPVEGAGELFSFLKSKGYFVALATSKPLCFAEEILKQYAWTEYFDAVMGSDLGGVKFPTKASVIQEVMAQLNANPEECLMVGDRFHDAEGAREMGMDCALLRKGGYATEEELQSSGAQYIFDDFADLTAFLEKDFL